MVEVVLVVTLGSFCPSRDREKWRSWSRLLASITAPFSGQREYDGSSPPASASGRHRALVQGAGRWGHGQGTEGEGWGRKRGKPLVPAPFPTTAGSEHGHSPQPFPKLTSYPMTGEA